MRKTEIIFLLALISSSVSGILLTKKRIEKYASQYPQNLEAFFNLDPPFLAPGQSTNNTVTQNLTSGYLNVNSSSSSALFYLFYQCRSLSSALNPKTNPLEVPILIWLNGGPGSSSMIGNYAELGPETIQFNSTSGEYYTQNRNISWNDFYHLMIIEQPIGVGYSYLNSPDEIPNNETGVAQQFLVALTNFYNLSAFSAFNQTPLYITGESYAGHYIPPMAKAIIQYNQNASAKIPLQGIAIGDGWVDAMSQVSTYGLFAYSMALIDSKEKEIVEQLSFNAYYYSKTALSILAQGNLPAALPFFDQAVNYVNEIPAYIQNVSGNINDYNFRIFGDYDFDNIVQYVNTTAIKTAWAVPLNMSYSISSSLVGKALGRWDQIVSCIDDVAFVLNYMPVLLYNGQDDMLINTAGTLEWIGKMQWPGNSDFYNAQHQTWVLNDKTTHAGYAQSARNLTFVLVYKSGHLVPMDQIDASVEMIRRFVEGVSNWTNNTTPDLRSSSKILKNFEVPSKEYLEAVYLGKPSNSDKVILTADL